MNSRKIIALFAVIAAQALAAPQDYASNPAETTPADYPPESTPVDYPAETTPVDHPAETTPCESTSTPAEPAETTPAPAGDYGDHPPPPPPCETHAPGGEGGEGGEGDAIFAVLFDDKDFGGEKHHIDGKVGECRGLSAVTVGSLKVVSVVGGDPFTQELPDSKATFEFFDDYNCAGNSIGQVTGSQSDTTTLIKQTLGEDTTTRPLSVRFVAEAGAAEDDETAEGDQQKEGQDSDGQGASASTNGATVTSVSGYLLGVVSAVAFFVL